MYTRAELKQMAKDQIKGRIGILFVCSLVICGIGFVAGLIPFAGSIAVTLFGPSLSMGLIMIYLGIANGKNPEVGDVFQCVKDWWRIFKAFFLVGLFTMLWSLLFIIPGYIKAFSYSMTFYILAENPDMTATEAINESKRMMDGHKWELFVLMLSFIPWFLLMFITLGLAGIYVAPYMSMTVINYYHMVSGQTVQPSNNGYDAQPTQGTM